MPTWPAGMSTRLAGGRGCGRGDAVARGGEVEQRHGESRRVIARAADRPLARARAGRRRRNPRSARARRGRAAARPRWPNPRARRSARASALSGSSCANLANLRDRALRVERPEGGLQHLHRQRARGVRGGCRALRHSRCSAARDVVGIAREMPWRGERRDALDRRRGWRRRSPSSRRGNSRSARPARRAARATAAAVARHGRRRRGPARSRGCAPVEQQRAAAHRRRSPPASDTSSSRSRMWGGLISDGTRIAGGAVAAMIAQRRAADLRGDRASAARGSLRCAAA